MDRDQAGPSGGSGDVLGIDLFVIGAMKAATTSMCDWLGEQPGVAMSSPKEPGIFNSDDAVASWAGRVDTLFASGASPRVRVEGSTFYTKFPSIAGVPERVRRHCPDARFVYLMRHPVERVLSQYRFDWLRGVNDLSLSRSLEQVPQLVDNSRYAFQLRQWLEVFPPDRFLLVFAEQFTADPEAQVGRVLDFAGVDAAEVVPPGNTHANRTDDIMRLTLARRLLRRSAFGRAIRPYVPGQLVRRYRDRARARSVPSVSTEDEQALAAMFDADLVDLTGLTDGPGITCRSWHEVTRSWTPRLSGS